MKKNRSISGFVLIDILVAITFLGVITASLFPTLSFLLIRSRTTQNVMDADIFVQEGIEVVYNIFATNWNAFDNGRYKKAEDTIGPKLQWTLQPLDPAEDETIQAKYHRVITIEPVKRNTSTGDVDVTGVDDPTSRKITVNVTWKEGAQDREAHASLLLYELTKP